MKSRGNAFVGAASLAVPLGACAVQKIGTVPTVPDSLKVPSTERLLLEAHAVGVQIYECKRTGSPERNEWVLTAPEAELFDSSGKKIGKHYAGPTWEFNDGTKVVGEVKARDEGPDANAIPWLLLSVRSSAVGGELSKTVSVQRLQTVGGKAPTGECSEAQAGKQIRVQYSARYYFYVKG